MYTPVHCMGTTGWGGHASVCGVYHICGFNVCAVQMRACMECAVIKLMFYSRRTGTGMGVLWLRSRFTVRATGVLQLRLRAYHG